MKPIGISEPTLRSLANDTLVLDRLSGNLEKMFQEYENNESGATVSEK